MKLKYLLILSLLCKIYAAKIGIIGTGYVGLVTGICFAEGGHNVTCVDISSERISNLNNGILPIYEDGLEGLVNKNINNNIFFTNDVKKTVEENDFIFLAVNTPSRDDGSCNTDFLENAFNDIIKVVKKQNQPKIVVTKSTVAIGTNFKLQKIADDHGLNKLISVVSNPEFLREGFAVHDCFNPSRIVVGSSDLTAAQKVASLYDFLNIPSKKIVVADTKTAELIKYASNSFLAMKLVFINELAMLCNKIDASIEQTSVGMGLDDRIGGLFLKAGPGISGSCFPKDVKALNYTLNLHGIDGIVKQITCVDNVYKKEIINKCFDLVGDIKNPKISLLGLTFKAGTDDIRDSMSVLLIDSFKNKATISAYDPKGIDNMKRLYPKINYYDNALSACVGADLVIIVTEWPEIAKLDINDLAQVVSHKNIVDLRNLFSVQEFINNNFKYFNLGRNN
jgi:UDPglucose 6-dehydrogenase